MNVTIPARTVGEAMTRGLVTVHEGARIFEAAQVMDAHRLHGLVVVDDERRVVGVVSQTDLLRVRSVDDSASRYTRSAVRHVMTSPAITVSVDTSLQDAAKLMRGRRVHRLVVVGPDGSTPVGILSVSDLVHVMAAEE